MHKDDKRSSIAEVMHAAVIDKAPCTTPGGRQPGEAYPHKGGGYLDNCTFSGASIQRVADPRIQELHTIGLNAQWLPIVEAIGFEAFILLWNLLSEMARKKLPYDEDPVIRFSMPQFSRYLKYQRNLVIERLYYEQNLTARQIYKMLPKSDKVSYGQLCRVIKKAKHRWIRD